MYDIIINGKITYGQLRLNGNNFISNTEIKGSDFPDAPFSVVISDGNAETLIENAELVQVKQYGSEWWFILRDIPAEELSRKKLQERVQTLEEALDMLLSGVTQ